MKKNKNKIVKEEQTISSRKVLKAALDQNISQVVLLGYDEEGELYIASASKKLDRVREILSIVQDKLKEAKQIEE